MTTWGWVGIALAIIAVCLYLWWHSRKSKAMEDKPKPK